MQKAVWGWLTGFIGLSLNKQEEWQKCHSFFILILLIYHIILSKYIFLFFHIYMKVEKKVYKSKIYIVAFNKNNEYHQNPFLGKQNVDEINTSSANLGRSKIG